MKLFRAIHNQQPIPVDEAIIPITTKTSANTIIQLIECMKDGKSKSKLIKETLSDPTTIRDKISYDKLVMRLYTNNQLQSKRWIDYGDDIREEMNESI